MSDDQADGWKHHSVPDSRPDPTADEIVEHIERLDFVYDAMAKVWAEIQANLRQPWRL